MAEPEDIRIRLENQGLTVRGEKRQVSEENGTHWHRYERTDGSFERSFTLPTSVDAEPIEAKVADGVLTLTLPKVERAKPREIAVKAGASKPHRPPRLTFPPCQVAESAAPLSEPWGPSVPTTFRSIGRPASGIPA